jgi:hypothetical protein
MYWLGELAGPMVHLNTVVGKRKISALSGIEFQSTSIGSLNIYNKHSTRKL